MGNRRLAEEFAYLQDPNVRKLEKWQNWKQQVRYSLFEECSVGTVGSLHVYSMTTLASFHDVE